MTETKRRLIQGGPGERFAVLQTFVDGEWQVTPQDEEDMGTMRLGSGVLSSLLNKKVVEGEVVGPKGGRDFVLPKRARGENVGR